MSRRLTRHRRTWMLPAATLTTSAFLLPSLLAPDVALAGTTGTLTGFITDGRGKPIAKARITVTSPSLQGQQTALTDDEGFYRLVSLPPGLYTVEVTIPGSVTRLRRDNIRLTIDTTLRVDLAQASTETTDNVMILTADAPVVDQGSTTVGANLSEKFLGDIPTNRTTAGVLELTPGAVNDGAGTGFRGASSPENNYIIDGVNTTSVIDGTVSTALPIEFIQDMQVKTGGYEAEFGRATGAVVNVRTKSGGNEWHGDIWSFVTPFEAPRKEQTYGDDPDIEGYDNAVRLQTKLRYDADFGADIGGPLVKDKLWFWVGAQPTLRSREYTRTIGDQVDVYQDHIRVGNFAAKLSYKPGEKHDLSLSFYGNPALKTGAAFTTAAGFAKDDAAIEGVIRNGAYDTSLRYNGRFHEDATVVEFIVGYHHQVEETRPPEGNNTQAIIHNYPYTPTDASGAPLQCENVVDESGQVVGSSDCLVDGVWQTGSLGAITYGEFDRLSSQLQVTHYLDGFLGNHKIKYGGDFEINRVHNEKSYAGGAYNLMYDPAGGPGTPGEGFDLAIEFSYAVPVGGECTDGGTYTEYVDLYTGDTAAMCVRDKFVADTQTDNVALFVQDAWSIRPNLTLSLGVRYDMQQLRDIDGNIGLAIYDNIAPRLGFIWDPSQAGKSKVFGSWGRFYESVPVGVNDRSFSLEGNSITYEDYGGAILLGGENSPVQRGLKGQYTDEAILGVQYEAKRDLALGASLVHRTLGNVIEDISFDNGGIYAVANPGTDGEYYTVDPETGEEVLIAQYYEEGGTCYAQYAEDGTYGEAFEVPCFVPATRTYDGLELTATKRFSDDWQLLASYVLSVTKGNYPGLFNSETGQLDPNISSQFDIAALLPNQEGFLDQDHRHALKVHGSYQLPFGLLTGLGVTALSGSPYSYLGADVEHGYGNGEVFLAPRGSAGRLPWQVEVDGNLGYRHQMTADRSLTFTVAAFNLLNSRRPTAVDENWTYDGTTPVAGASSPDQFICDADQDGTYANDECTQNVNFGQPTAFQRPLHLRLGAKLTF